MDAVQMRDLMEHYGKLRSGVETCKGNIRRIRSGTFDEYIEEKTRKQFELERDFQLRSEQRRLAVKQALLWQLNSLIDRLDEKEREIIVRRYVEGVRVEELYEVIGISRATAFRRLEAGILRMADLYREMYEQAA